MVFERANLLADRRRGDGQLVRRPGKGQVASGRIEHAQGVERQERALHDGRSASPVAAASQAAGQCAVAGAASGKKGIRTSIGVPSSRWKV